MKDSTMTPVREGTLRRVLNAWERFWFTPADPTPLCFMRIVAGLLTLYVHVAYTFHLVPFFGPQGWYDQKTSNENRLTYPHLKAVTDWETAPPPFRLPPDPTQRESLCNFVGRVVAAPDSEKALQFINSMAQAGELRQEMVHFLFDHLPSDTQLRQTALQQYVELGPNSGLPGTLPAYLRNAATPDERAKLAAGAVQFAAAVPPQDPLRQSLIRVLLDAGTNDWHALAAFIRDIAKLDTPAQREAELAFQTTWGLPSAMTHATGWRTYSPWFHVTDLRWLWTIHGLHLFVITLFVLGMYTRVTSVMTWLIGLSYINRAQPYLYGQDTMMNLSLLYLMLSPCGAKWSLDRYMARKRATALGLTLPPVEPSVSAGVVIRIFQIQYCFIYLSAGLAKFKGAAWWDGTALFRCMANPEFVPMHMGWYQSALQWLCSHRLLWEFATSGMALFTLVLQVSFPWAIWTKARPALLVCSIMLHTTISLLMGLSVFCLLMLTLLICWFPPDIINWMFERQPMSSKPLAESPPVGAAA